LAEAGESDEDESREAWVGVTGEVAQVDVVEAIWGGERGA
jgi:hypothetical protein